MLTVGSNFTGGYGGSCYSEMPYSAFTATTACERVIKGEAITKVPATVTFIGATITGESLSFTMSSDYYKPVTTTLGPDASSTLKAVAWTPVIYLAQKATDTPKSTTVLSSTAASHRLSLHIGEFVLLISLWTIFAYAWN
jgi:hypothetical protein